MEDVNYLTESQASWNLLLSHFSRVQLCATPEMAAHQAPQSLGFSRQEHCRGLPFPSPIHESEKSKWSRSVMSDSVTPWTAAYPAPPSMGFSRQEYWSGVLLPSPRDDYTWTSLYGQYWNQNDYILCSWRWRISTQQQKQDWELTMAQVMSSLLQKSDLNWRK